MMKQKFTYFLVFTILIFHSFTSSAHRLENKPYIVIQNQYDKGKDFFIEAGMENVKQVEDSVFTGIQLNPEVSGQIREGTYTSRIVKFDLPVNELVPSWNITQREGTGFEIYIRVHNSEDRWSSWFFLGSNGICQKSGMQRITREQGFGWVDQDYLLINPPALEMQYQVILKSENDFNPTLVRFSYAIANNTGNQNLWETSQKSHLNNGVKLISRFPIPYRSQLRELKDPGAICSPTSVSMVLDYHGISRTVAEVASECFNQDYGIYGIWSQNTQVAFEMGCEAWVHRFSTMEEVADFLEKGIPVVASIKFGRGVLRGAPISRTSGHLIVLAGMSAEGDLYTYDPAAWNPEEGVVTYNKDDLTKAWLDKGGVGYVILPPQRDCGKK